MSGLFRRFDEEKALNEVIWSMISDIERLQTRVTHLEEKVKELEKKLGR